ncbi:hypothetical protein NHX12_014133, partial [Muraenolepis orangiensis]
MEIQPGVVQTTVNCTNLGMFNNPNIDSFHTGTGLLLVELDPTLFEEAYRQKTAKEDIPEVRNARRRLEAEWDRRWSLWPRSCVTIPRNISKDEIPEMRNARRLEAERDRRWSLWPRSCVTIPQKTAKEDIPEVRNARRRLEAEWDRRWSLWPRSCALSFLSLPWRRCLLKPGLRVFLRFPLNGISQGCNPRDEERQAVGGREGPAVEPLASFLCDPTETAKDDIPEVRNARRRLEAEWDRRWSLWPRSCVTIPRCPFSLPWRRCLLKPGLRVFLRFPLILPRVSLLSDDRADLREITTDRYGADKLFCGLLSLGDKDLDNAGLVAATALHSLHSLEALESITLSRQEYSRTKL